jgi:hypothetical protein
MTLHAFPPTNSRRRIAQLAGVFAALCFATVPAVRAAETPVSIAIDPAHPGAAIGPEFCGLSYEVSMLLPAANGAHYFSPDNAPLLALFRTLGIRSLRVGGNTSDRNVKQLPSEADLDSLFAFAKAAGVKVVYCLRLHNGDPATAAATAKYIMDRYAPLVDSLSIGQEPSAYPTEKVDKRAASERMGATNEKYPYTSYRDEWKKFATAIVAAVPNVKFCGPGVHNNADWARRFMADFGRDHHVALITEHLYAGGAAGKLPSAQVGRDRMLSDDFTRTYQKLHDGFVPQAKALGLPYRLEEVNSYFNGGAQDASNTFASALWGVDFMYWWAAHDAAGLNFHTGDRVSMNNALQAPRYATFISAPDGFEIRPLAYGLKLFDLGAHGRFVPLTLGNPEKMNLTAYGTVANDKTIYVTIINREHGDGARAATVTLASGTKASRARIVYLKASDSNVAATSGITLGDASITKDGGWSGKWEPLPAPAADGSLHIAVPVASAAVVAIEQ